MGSPRRRRPRHPPFSAASGLLGIRQAGTPTDTIAAALSRVQDAFLFGGYAAAALAIAPSSCIDETPAHLQHDRSGRSLHRMVRGPAACRPGG